jgi:DNA-binding transcriptional MerR regulator
MNQAIKNDFLVTSEAARELQVTPSTARWLANTGKLQVIRTANGTRIYLAADVERLKRERQEKRRA